MKISHYCSCRSLRADILDYQTNKIAVIQNTHVVYFLRILQAGILLYVILYTLWFKKGYQDSYGLSSSVVVKAKGFGLANYPNNQRIIWDIADSVVPPQEANAIFITTNVIETYNQTQGVCPENPNVLNSTCETNADCQKNKKLYLGNGFMTGNCVQATPDIKTCEIKSWCPLENDTMKDTETPMIKEVPNYTMLIRNTIIFDEVNVQRSNLFAITSELIPAICIYNASDNLLKYCPIFKVSTLIGSINETDLTELLVYGGIIRVIITWECNLDESHESCRPEYSFSRLFTKYGKFSKGWNFRYANYYERNLKEYRALFKVYGLRILIEVRGKARKLSMFTLSMNVGSGIALLTIATIVCDFLMTSILPKRDKYCEIIYEYHNILSKNNNSENIQMIDKQIPTVKEPLFINPELEETA